jgi:hypothetical protein
MGCVVARRFNYNVYLFLPDTSFFDFSIKKVLLDKKIKKAVKEKCQGKSDKVTFLARGRKGDVICKIL